MLVNLWASWCLPCQREMPRLQQAYDSVGDKVLFVGIDVLDSPGSAASFLRAVGATYIQVVDSEGQSRHAAGAPGLPATLFIDENGDVVYRRYGELKDAQLRDGLFNVGVHLPAR